MTSPIPVLMQTSPSAKVHGIPGLSCLAQLFTVAIDGADQATEYDLMLAARAYWVIRKARRERYADENKSRKVLDTAR